MRTKKNNIYLDKEVIIGKNVKIFENVFIYGKSVIEDDVIIYPNCQILNSIIKKGSVINQSVIEDSIIGENNKIGPFSHLRPKTETANNVSLGSFVEVKNSYIGKGSKANHLAYIGDAYVGENVNIGCGVVFVNFNGRIKQKVQVGNNSFIGSNSNIIAPVSIGNDVYICAGTTITSDIEDGDFVIGRVRQEVKKSKAKHYLKEK